MSDSFNLNIRKCIKLLHDIDFLYQAGTTVSLNASDEFKRASRKSVSYRDLYDIGSKMQDFNLMLNDSSFFQFTENIENEDIRLAYYPNPYVFSEYKNQKTEALEMLNNSEITIEEYDQLISEEFDVMDKPIIRYDLSLRQHCVNYHPAAHFHIGFVSENRWPVKRILSPLAFLFKILMHYYPRLWKLKGSCGESEPNRLDELYREELSKCSYLDSNFFTSIESNRLYFN